ncbi:MAG: anti-sigma factor [Rhodospirillaceae bacterium]|nr:anti-sigma factor [Rhodospirillaceae bacterium]MDD9916688.1 anti-sigma factor [Rhodospirillaceae bacterium]MDD9925208.1 anti-sigma factor [Rhodospirillaceae bacterium]
MTPPAPVTEQELHAYVDGALDAETRARVEAWLAENPGDAAKVAAYTAQNEALHQAFDPILNESVPSALATRSTPTTAARRPAWMQIAAAIVLLIVGGAVGWLLRDQAETGQLAVADNAISAHSIYIKERRHAVEVEAKQEKHLVKWLSKRLGQTIKTPDLLPMGYRLVGGRLLPDDGKPAAQFMYENEAKERLTVYVRRNIESRETAFQFVSDKGVSAFYWIDADFAYALVGKMNRDGLQEAAKIIHRDLVTRN